MECGKHSTAVILVSLFLYNEGLLSIERPFSLPSNHLQHYFELQGLNPGRAIGEIKKMLVTYNKKDAAHA